MINVLTLITDPDARKLLNLGLSMAGRDNIAINAVNNVGQAFGDLALKDYDAVVIDTMDGKWKRFAEGVKNLYPEIEIFGFTGSPGDMEDLGKGRVYDKVPQGEQSTMSSLTHMYITMRDAVGKHPKQMGV